MSKIRCVLSITWMLFGLIGITSSLATFVVAEEMPVNLRNAGGAQCKDLLFAFERGSELNRTAYLQWAAGYATAVAQSNNVIDVYPLSDSLGLVEMALLICREPGYSEGRYQSVLLVAISRLRPFWSTNPSIVTVNNSDGASVSIYTDAVKPLQEALIKLGVEMPADGDFGSMTGRAFTQLHKLLNLPETPIPNGISLYALTKP